FVFGDRHHHFERLIGELDKMRRVQTAVVSEPFAAGNQRRPADAHRARFLDEPMAKRLAAMAVVLLGEERQLETVHGTSSPARFNQGASSTPRPMRRSAAMP